jgi:hypothetical protein
MIRDQERGLAFEPPDGWVDKTMVVFAAPGPDEPAAANMVVTNEILTADESVRSRADKLLMTAARQFNDFDLIATTPTTLGGLPALQMRFTWTSSFGRLEQTVTSVEREMNGRRVLTSVTTCAPEWEAEATRPSFRAVLESFRFVPVDGPEPPSNVPPPKSELPRTPHVPIPGHRGSKEG